MLKLCNRSQTETLELIADYIQFGLFPCYLLLTAKMLAYPLGFPSVSLVNLRNFLPYSLYAFE